MRIFLFLVFSLLCNSMKAETMAFVGSHLSAALAPEDCHYYFTPQTVGDRTEICMDRVFELEYLVHEWITERREVEDTVHFFSRYHYWGMPRYTMYETALVILEKGEPGYVLLRIEEIEESETGWEFCSDWSDDYDCLARTNISKILSDYGLGS